MIFLGIFDYKHNKITPFKPRIISETKNDDVTLDSFEYEETSEIDDFYNSDNLIKTFNFILGSKSFELNPATDSELIDSVTVFSENITEALPNFDGYLTTDKNGYVKANASVLIDAIDFLKSVGNNNLASDFTELSNKSIAVGDGNFFITPTGKIFRNNEIIFDIEDSEKNTLKSIDFKNKKIFFKSGVEIPFGVFSTSDLKLENSSFFSANADSFKTFEENSIFVSEFLFEQLILRNDSLKNKSLDKVDFSGSKLSFDDLSFVFESSSAKNSINSYILNKENFENSNAADEFENCTNGKINFMYLLLLIILGGGKEGQGPVAQKGSNSSNSHCEVKSYNTWHNLLWSDSNKKGIPVSILQILHAVLSPFFGLNIDRWDIRICISIKIFKKRIKKCWSWTVFEGWCICGHLEIAIFKFQEKISEEIRNMFYCKKTFLKPTFLNISTSDTSENINVKKPDLSALNSEELKQQIDEYGNIIKVINNY